MKKISIVVACYNEFLNIEPMHTKIQNIFKKLNYQYELIFVDNASTDSSQQLYQKIAFEDSNVKVLIMSRNFGSSQPSFFAGLMHASGDAVVMIDGDLQDPPEVIPDLIQKWESGFDVVYAVRKKRKGSIIRRIGYTCFYRIFRWFSYINIPLDAGDFSLMGRNVVEHIKCFKERDLYIRGLRAWVGFKQVGVEYVRDDRHAGKTSCSFWANFFWAKKAIVNFSYKPLEFISLMASLTMLLSVVAILVYICLGLIFKTPRGFTTLLAIILFLGSVQLLALSIIGEYLARIFEEVKGRPHYIIKEELCKPVFRTKNTNAVFSTKNRDVGDKI
jgi:dolichol-phosphate mannosyltransferase